MMKQNQFSRQDSAELVDEESKQSVQQPKKTINVSVNLNQKSQEQVLKEQTIKNQADKKAQIQMDNQAILDTIKKDTFEDRAYGCVLGAFIADSCGSYLEFNCNIATEDQMDKCMTMPGGGQWGSAPGQVTDDSELAMCILHALCEGNQNIKPDQESVLSTQKIAEYFKKWIESPPFDIGFATRSALGPLTYKCSPDVAKTSAFNSNQASQSNGSLMRMTPLSVWASSLNTPEEMYEAVKVQTEFTHPGKIVHDAVFIYTAAIQYLLNNPMDPDRAKNAFDLAVEHSKNIANADVKGDSCYNWLDLSLNIHAKVEKLGMYSASDDVDKKERYIHEIFKLINPQAKMGHVKHAFVFCFFFLLQFQQFKDQSIYSNALRVTIQLGGDTDTNGAILGGMLGALVGLQGIPEHMVQTLLGFDCTEKFHRRHRNGITRPDFLNTGKYVLPLVQKLIQVRPKEKLVVDKEFKQPVKQQNNIFFDAR